MKTLILMRHAKAGWGDGAVTDIDRPLTDRGLAQAGACANWLNQPQRQLPDRVLVSTSRRTRETWEVLAEALRGPVPEYLAALYHAGPAEILAIIARLGQGARCVLVIGHNPGIAELAGALAGGDPPLTLRQFAPATTAVFTCNNADWAQLRSAGAILTDHFVPPK